MKALLARWMDMLGVTGTAGIGLAVFCAGFYVGTIRPAEGRLVQLRSEHARLDQNKVVRAREGVGTGSLEEQLQAFYGVLGSEPEIGELLDKIDAAARRNGIVLHQGSYRFNWEAGTPAGRYEVTYTAQTPYYRARVFLHEVLYEMPMLSLDEVAFQRQQVTAPATDFTARFVILVRRQS